MSDTKEAPALLGEVWRERDRGGWLHAVDAEGRLFWWNPRGIPEPKWVACGETIQIMAMRSAFLAQRAEVDRLTRERDELRESSDRAETMCGAAVETSCDDVAAMLEWKRRAEQAERELAEARAALAQATARRSRMDEAERRFEEFDREIAESMASMKRHGAP